ncbi:hypothetical protein [Frondihabitans australicus]|uniref:Uncharacterized protein n=1 Tax=Frondihabitans australicus TaxID=386892 RepID=A0A495IHF2_9MICO|nr:hypothetical protein [Frondihabitans australicus]RKR74741.1 hypothetical protein C8E83_1870 [Frondihabitans australicus]
MQNIETPAEISAEPWNDIDMTDVVVPIPVTAFDLDALAARPAPDEAEWPEDIAGCLYCLGSGILPSYDEGEIPCYCDR